MIELDSADVSSQRVRELREARSWSRADLAARAGTTPTAVRQWETGQRKVAPHEVGPLAFALGVQPETLAERAAGR